MFPFLTLLGSEIPTIAAFAVMAWLLAMLITFHFNPTLGWGTVIAIVSVVSLSALLGTKAGSLIFEADSASLLGGRMFYGGLICAFFVLFWHTHRQPPERAAGLWRAAFLSTSLAYGILRVGCFAAGCCWGDITDSALAVVYYDSRSAMPLLGVPVHPVQLYDAALGFLIAAVLWWSKERPVAIQAALFFILMSIGRLLTEMFRGDEQRGVNLVFGLSTSQVLSILLLVTVVLAYPILRRWLNRPDSSGPPRSNVFAPGLDHRSPSPRVQG